MWSKIGTIFSTHLHLAPPFKWGWKPYCNLTKVFGREKLEYLGHHAALID